MQMDVGLDTGDTVLINELDITSEETSSSLHHRLAELGAQSIVDTLNCLQVGKALIRTPQARNGITYAEKILKSEAEIDWNLSAQEVDRRIRAFNPFPGATSNTQKLEIKFWNSRIPKAGAINKTGQPGELLGLSEKGAFIQCGQGAIEILEMQKPGGKKMPANLCLQSLGNREHALRFYKK
jgi:methionyl-tRNA formyltransferase